MAGFRRRLHACRARMPHQHRPTPRSHEGARLEPQLALRHPPLIPPLAPSRAKDPYAGALAPSAPSSAGTVTFTLLNSVQYFTPERQQITAWTFIHKAR